MLFNTGAFGVFVVVVCVAFWGLARRRLARKLLLLTASLYFYAAWDARFLWLLLAVTLLDYAAGRLIERVHDARARLMVLAVTVGANLGLLGFWKYAGWLVESFAPLWPAVGLPPPSPMSIVLPVGISFFTFQGLSYVVDVYRADIPAERSLLSFSLYIAFFPQLVAGPIVRARDLLHQIDPEPVVRAEAFGRGLWLVLGGLAKKIVLADYLAHNLVDRVFDLPGRYGSLEVLAAVYGYALQIYGDFSGYTDVAIGVALWLGFELPPNFDLPYRADSLRDFWRRWHISLSTWLRDYLYIPLGGSAGGRLRTARNLLLTMLLGGLWHGAGLNFVAWGGLHGLGLVLERTGAGRVVDRLPRWVRVMVTFHVVCVLWVLFRAETFAAAGEVLAQLVRGVPGVANLRAPVLAVLLGGLLLHHAPSGLRARLERAFTRAPALAQAAVTVALLYAAKHFAAAAPAPFIYFQF